MVDHSKQSPGPRKSRRWLFGLLMVLVVAVLCWWFWPAKKSPESGAAAPASAGRNAGSARPGFGGSAEPTPVRVADVVTGDFPVYYKALGTVTAINTVNVRSRVAGELVKVNFQEGQRVKAGDLLAEIDPRSYEIALQQAQGTLAQNQAQLKNAQIDLQRYKGLFAEDSIARQTLDTQQALVGQYQGTIQTNQAAVNDAKLNLDFTRIRAPIAGRLGLRQLDIGNLVAANDTSVLVVITQVQPITVAFTLPESELTPVLARYRSGAKLTVEAWDRGDTRKQATGVLGSLDNQIDTTTGTLKFKALFDNQDEALFPNQFVNVRLLSDILKGVVLVPSAAVQYGVDGTFVYAMDGNDKVKIRQLKVGPTDGANTVVEQGLAQGDRVVLEGTDRLRDGSRVEVVDDSAKVPTTPGQHLQGQDGAGVPGEKGKTGA
ncbi:MdtA/MuxA family multidrug efflux RND transporter periplasmic adaptor subunit [Pseudomonas coleopterorum]|uniref:MdtA/MuxA family multidrug efflux RND transporter periplasmic adaptor subunit n=1 Tax=Pseudomonas coleopterorum TaxID=1605838 RepID=UPI0008942F27|nr:MdtA/MuxA family multidrug efflux RND transporter periplasmic adaptor subunit [Pseudomonas coleopterorum]SEE23767.1 membrane fusion protein, multidrug efflux system [Pseudomonas coleopterorum]